MGEALPGQGNNDNTLIGQWLPGFVHPGNGMSGWPSSFNAIHLAVIPDRSLGGNPNDVVIAWDSQYRDPNIQPVPPLPWNQRYVVGNPETQVFTNRWVTIPLGPNGLFYGDLFCAGHVWLPDGRLFIAGGNTQYANLAGNVPNFVGSQFVGLWDPLLANSAAANYGWTFLASGTNPKPMHLKRWYPTVTLISDRLVMVSGGASDTAIPQSQDPAINTYEIFDFSPTVMDWERDPNSMPPNLPRLYNGPASPQLLLSQYPRLALLSNNRAFLSGSWQHSSAVDHVSNLPVQAWTAPLSSGSPRGAGSSVLVPNVGNIPALRDELMIMGGADAPSVWNTSRRILAGSATPAWGTPQTMYAARMVGNAVLGPNGDVVMIGGSGDYYFNSTNHLPVRTTEVWDRINGWQMDAAQAASRMYHSTGALLPSGRMVSAGSDYRTTVGGVTVDWEVYVPRNIACGQAIPRFAGTWANAGFMTIPFGSGTYLIEHDPLPVGVAVSRVVLMRPCSTTHHSDMDQRYVELLTEPDPAGVGDMIQITAPAAPNWFGTMQGSVTTLPGWYMAFLVTTEGAVSRCKWVILQ